MSGINKRLLRSSQKEILGQYNMGISNELLQIEKG